MISCGGEGLGIDSRLTCLAKIVLESYFAAEVESSRTSLAWRTPFQVLGLEACKSLKMFCLRLKDSIIF